MSFQRILANVIRPTGGDCSNHGVSSWADLVMLWDGVGERPDTDLPVLKLVVRWAGTSREYLHCEPPDPPKNVVGPMFGGNFIYCSDSRFPSQYPIPIHDRFETVEDYNAITR